MVRMEEKMSVLRELAQKMDMEDDKKRAIDLMEFAQKMDETDKRECFIDDLEDALKNNLAEERKELFKLMKFEQEMISLNIDVTLVQNKNIKDPPDAYKNDSGPPRGAIFIANYRKIRNQEITNGSEINVENLTNLFRQMGYKAVEGIQDKTKTETIEAMESFREHKIHQGVDTMVLVVMSHALNHNTFLTSDGKSMTNQEIYQIYSDKNCKYLKENTKIVIFQHCRNNIDIMNDPDKQQNKYPNLSDILLLYSCKAGQLSKRHKKYGSLFIVKICQVFMEMSCQSEWNNLLEEEVKIMPKDQRCQWGDSGYREKDTFFFNPKCIKDNDAIQEVQSATSSTTKINSGIDGDNYGKLEMQLTKDQGHHASSSIPKVNPSTKNHVLLINNIDGCRSDMDTLKDLFSYMGYNDIELVLNTTYEELKKVLENFKKKDHGDSAMIIFYCDGFSDNIVTTDHYAIHIKDLQKQFNDINCPNLRNKPKIFITHLCYFEGDVKFGSASDENNEISNESSYQIPGERNMFFLNIEMERKGCEKGSLLTKALYQVLMENRLPKKIMNIMREVLRKLRELQNGHLTYSCELINIRFPPDFYIYPIRTCQK